MAISSVGDVTGSTTTGTSVTITLPGGIAENDVVYAGVMSSEAVDVDCSEGSGTYTELADLYADDISNTNFCVYRKVQGGTPDSSVTITSRTTSGGSLGVAKTLRGVDTTTPEDAPTTTATGIDSGTPDPPSIATATADAWVLPFAGSSEGDAVTNAPNNYSDLIDVQGANRNAMCSRREIASPATEDPDPYADVVGIADDCWAAATVAVRPAGGGGGGPAVVLMGQALF